MRYHRGCVRTVTNWLTYWMKYIMRIRSGNLCVYYLTLITSRSAEAEHRTGWGDLWGPYSPMRFQAPLCSCTADLPRSRQTSLCKCWRILKFLLEPTELFPTLVWRSKETSRTSHGGCSDPGWLASLNPKVKVIQAGVLQKQLYTILH